MRPFALIPGIAYLAVALALFIYVSRTRRAAKAAGAGALPLAFDAVWGRAYALVAAALGAWMLVWPFDGAPWPALALALVTLALGLVATNRRKVMRRLLGLRHASAGAEAPTASRARHAAGAPTAPRPLRALLLLLASFFAMAALEVPWNDYFLNANAPHAILLEYLLVLLLMVSLYLLSLRHGIVPGFAVGILAAIGVVQAFVIDFKGAVLSVGDLFAFGTAMAVSGGYEYHLAAAKLLGITCAELGGLACLLIFDAPGQSGTRGRHAGRLVACGLGTLALLAALVLVPNYQRDLGITVDYWWEWQLIHHKQDGFFPSFIAEAQDLPISRPRGYSAAAAASAEDELAAAFRQGRGSDPAVGAARAQWDTLQPSVVVVMNETFTDLSTFGGPGDPTCADANAGALDLGGYPGPTFFKTGLPDALSRGKLSVSVNGGGTCNTEFEFLTGFSMAYVGNGKYPYTLYDLDGVEALPAQMRKLGYQTCAIHPNLATNWDRDQVYQALGFDEFYDIEDFQGASQVHNATSDAATYQRILQQLRQGDGPQFIFDVTMQNHSGYDQGGLPKDLVQACRAFGNPKLGGETNAALREYLACIQSSDQALADFVGQLRQLDRPVILIFFGDHQPYFTNVVNDALCKDGESVAHEERLYQSDYVVWANYDVDGSAQDGREAPASASDLAAQALLAAGAPLTERQEATLGAAEACPRLNLYGYQDADGAWHALGEDADAAAETDAARAAADAVDKLRLVFYRDFALRVRR